jgi:hypothetical protein
MQNSQIAQPIFSSQGTPNYESLQQSLINIKAPLNYTASLNNQRMPINLNSEKLRENGKDHQNLGMIYH